MAARSTKRRRRRGRFGILYVLLSIVLIFGAIAGGSIVFFRVEDITVSGCSIYTQEEIIAAAGIQEGDNLFLIGKVSTARKILQALPYVKDVSPKRELPGTMNIIINECTPVAAVKGTDGSWWVIDEDAKLLEQGGGELRGQYAQVTGLELLMPSAGSNLAVSVEESGKLNALKQILSALKKRGMVQQLGDMDLSGTTEITFAYEGRFDVCLPMYSDNFSQLIHTLDEIAAYLDDGQIGTIDMTGSQARFIPD